MAFSFVIREIIEQIPSLFFLVAKEEIHKLLPAPKFIDKGFAKPVPSTEDNADYYSCEAHKRHMIKNCFHILKLI